MYIYPVKGFQNTAKIEEKSPFFTRYRFSFNGKENDNEVKGTGNSIDYGARIYDPRIGRWLSTDPLANNFPFISPYSFVENNPIYFLDLDGRVKVDANGNVIFKAIGEPVLVNHPSGSTAMVQMGIIYADDGTEIQAFKNLSEDKGWDTDCHGVTFAFGQVWISNDQVDKLLAGDNYVPIDKTEATRKDIVIFRDKNTEPEHSVTVVDTKDGKIIVSGQGGLEVENHEDEVDKCWDKNSKQNYYRKVEKNESTSPQNKFKLDLSIPPIERDNTDVGKGGNTADGL